MKHLCVLYTNLNLTKTQDKKEKNEKPQYRRGNNRRGNFRSEMS